MGFKCTHIHSRLSFQFNDPAVNPFVQRETFVVLLERVQPELLGQSKDLGLGVVVDPTGTQLDDSVSAPALHRPRPPTEPVLSLQHNGTQTSLVELINRCQSRETPAHDDHIYFDRFGIA